MFVEDLFQGERAVAVAGFAVAAFAEDEAGDPVQRAHQLERVLNARSMRYGARPVVFQEQDRR